MYLYRYIIMCVYVCAFYSVSMSATIGNSVYTCACVGHVHYIHVEVVLQLPTTCFILVYCTILDGDLM